MFSASFRPRLARTSAAAAIRSLVAAPSRSECFTSPLRVAVGLLALVAVAPTPVFAAGGTVFGGVHFPDGAASFADAVLTVTPSATCLPGSPNFLDPVEALGPPDYSGGQGGTGAVSLGEGGVLEVSFLDNRLTNSGDLLPDLHVFEVGPQVERTFVAIRPADAATLALVTGFVPDADGDGFFELGVLEGSTSSLDIDGLLPPAPAGLLRFDAVQLRDDPNDSSPCGGATGADIDAVGALASELSQYPGTADDLFLETGVGGALATGGPGEDIKVATAGTLFEARVSSPGGTFHGAPILIMAQLFATGGPAPVFAADPAVHLAFDVQPAPVILFDGGVMTPFGPTGGLAPSGTALAWYLPAFLADASIMVQAFAISPAASNGGYAATDGHEIVLP